MLPVWPMMRSAQLAGRYRRADLLERPVTCLQQDGEATFCAYHVHVAAF